MAKDEAYKQAEKKIEKALQSRATELDLRSMKLTELPESIGQLTQLTELNLSDNQLVTLPDVLGLLSQLQTLYIANNSLATLPDWIGKLKQLQILHAHRNKLTELPKSLIELNYLFQLGVAHNQFKNIPDVVRRLPDLRRLYIHDNHLIRIPDWLGEIRNLTDLTVGENPLNGLLPSLEKLQNLDYLNLNNIKLTQLPDWVLKITRIRKLYLRGNNIIDLPYNLAELEYLETFELKNNPLNPALQSAYDACDKLQGKGKYEPLFAYLRSLEQNAEPLYEAKLVLVGEGNVGKTTLLKAMRMESKAGKNWLSLGKDALLKALKGKEDIAPRKNEPTTHGVEIDIHGLRLPHPSHNGVEIKINAWDFGGQDVYRVTHQFFFSRRSLYLLVWEPRNNVQQGRLDEWLDMIRLRVGNEARVIIISTHSQSGGHLARIDKPVFKERYGDMIVGFHEVDSLIPDPSTGEMFGIAELKNVIAEESAKLEQMGMLFNNNWKAARDELLAREEPRISFGVFSEVCARHNLSQIDTDTLAHLMHDLGYIVHYSDDEKLRDDVILKPEWLTKAIGFVLEDHVTHEMDGVLPDDRLYQVWHDHPFKDEPQRYTPDLYPFFLRLMEKYDVSYRLMDGKASLVAQHVSQVRPELPWLSEQEPPKDLRRIALVCSLEEDPAGLVPWMIVRTHDYATQFKGHRLHWDKGMFLRHGTHGEAFLEKRAREFHVYVQGKWPEYFMNILQNTLEKLMENWPGMENRYRFTVPCPEAPDGQPCKGRFNIHTLREILADGDTTIRCQECVKKQSITELLMGFEERDISVQLREIQEQLAGMDSRIANYFMATMNAIADEAKNGPRLFTFRSRDAGLSPKQIFTRPISLQLWCEAEGCQHPIIEDGKGLYSIDQPHDWVMQIAPYANFAFDILKTVAPIAAPAINTFFGAKTTELWGIADHLSLASAIISKLPDEVKTPDKPMLQRGMVSEPERSGILALHRLLNELDPNQENLGLHRVATYTGDFRWLCKRHYDAYQPNIPDVIPTPTH